MSEEDFEVPVRKTPETLEDFLHQRRTTLVFTANSLDYNYSATSLASEGGTKNEEGEVTSSKAESPTPAVRPHFFSYDLNTDTVRILMGHVQGKAMVPVVEDRTLPMVFGEVRGDEVTIRFHSYEKLKEHWGHVSEQNRTWKETSETTSREQPLSVLQSAALTFNLPTLDPAAVKRKLDGLEGDGNIDPELKQGAVLGLMKELLLRGQVDGRQVDKIAALGAILSEYRQASQQIER